MQAHSKKDEIGMGMGKKNGNEIEIERIEEMGKMVSSGEAGDVQVKSQVRLRVGEIGRKGRIEIGNGEN